jgi:hypothetical protein
MIATLVVGYSSLGTLMDGLKSSVDLFSSLLIRFIGDAGVIIFVIFLKKYYLN